LPRSSAFLVLLGLITRVFGEEYQLWSSSLRSFLQSPLTFFLSLRFMYLPQHLFLRHH
jgi:hypothetical protein